MIMFSFVPYDLRIQQFMLQELIRQSTGPVNLEIYSFDTNGVNIGVHQPSFFPRNYHDAKKPYCKWGNLTGMSSLSNGNRILCRGSYRGCTVTKPRTTNRGKSPQQRCYPYRSLTRPAKDCIDPHDTRLTFILEIVLPFLTPLRLLIIQISQDFFNLNYPHMACKLRGLGSIREVLSRSLATFHCHCMDFTRSDSGQYLLAKSCSGS